MQPTLARWPPVICRWRAQNISFGAVLEIADVGSGENRAIFVDSSKGKMLTALLA